MHFLSYFYYTALITLLGTLTKEFSHALRDVRVSIPQAVRRGEKVTLKCYYDIEGDTVYSVKWYKGRREFYRYTPKENPPMKIFHFPSLKVDRSASNESQLVLEAIHMTTTGKYSCEVSADAPSFHTLIAAGELEVVEIPHNAPFITGIRARYSVGEVLRGNCTSRHSKPAANLTWTLNNEEVDLVHIHHHRIQKDARYDVETSSLGLKFIVLPKHFENGRMKLRCIAEISNVYWKATEKVILDANLQDANYEDIDNSVPLPEDIGYDQYALHDSELSHKKHTYLTQLQGGTHHDDAAWVTRSVGAPARLSLPATTALQLMLQIWLLYWICKHLPTLLGATLLQRNAATTLSSHSKYDCAVAIAKRQKCCICSSHMGRRCWTNHVCSVRHSALET